MAGGAFGNAAEGAEKLANALTSVQQTSELASTSLGVLKAGLTETFSRSFIQQLEATTQALYKVRMSLGVSVTDALRFAEAVRSIGKAQVSTTRGLVEMFATLRSSSGLLLNTNEQLAAIAKRLQHEFPQASQQSAQALAQMSDQITDFDYLMSKNIDSTVAWAQANQRFGSEYARVLLAARGDLEGVTDQYQLLLTLFKESETSVDEMSQTWGKAFQGVAAGLLGMRKTAAEVINWIGQLGGGEVGKTIAPIISTIGMLVAGKAALGTYNFATSLKSKLETGGFSALTTAAKGAVPVTVQNWPAGAMAGDLSGPNAPNAAPQKQWAWWRLRRYGINATGKALSPEEQEMLMANRSAAINRTFTTAMIGLSAAQLASSGYQQGKMGQGATAGSVLGAAGAGAATGFVFGGPWGAAGGAVVGAGIEVVSKQIGMSNYILEDLKNLTKESNDLARQNLLADRIAGARTPEEGRAIMRSALGVTIAQESISYKGALAGEKIAKEAKIKLEEQIQGAPEWAKFFSPGWGNKELEEVQKEIDEAVKEKERALGALSLAQAKMVQSGLTEVAIASSRVRGVEAQASLLGISAKTSDFPAIQQMMMLGAGNRRRISSSRDIAIGALIAQQMGAKSAAFMERFGTSQSQAELANILGSGQSADQVQSRLGAILGEENLDIAKEILRIYEQTPEIQDQIIEKTNDERLALEGEKNALMDVFNRTVALASLRKQEIETLRQRAELLKAPPMVSAVLTVKAMAQQSNIIRENEAKLQSMLENRGKFSDEDIQRQRTELEAARTELMQQADYIRRGWEEMFTQTALNLPGGGYLLQNMTGLMEKGPAFAPFTPSAMTNGRLAGHGTYEAIMGYGKASAFSLFHQQLQDAVGGVKEFTEALSDVSKFMREHAGEFAGMTAD